MVPSLHSGLKWHIPNPPTNSHRMIEVYACLGVIGTADDTSTYSMWLDPQLVEEKAYDINHLEALNFIIALYISFRDSDHGSHIHVLCDNQAAVHVLTTGRGHEPRLIYAAHSAWMLQAMQRVKVSFHHVSGIDNHLAEALSCVPISNTHKAIAMKTCTDRNLRHVQPCLYGYQQHDFSHLLTPDVQCAPGSSGCMATESEGTRNMGQLPGTPMARNTVRGTKCPNWHPHQGAGWRTLQPNNAHLQWPTQCPTYRCSSS